MDSAEFFPSKYLKAEDFAGKEVNLTIDRAESEDIGERKERKIVVFFVGIDKGLILNKTNFMAIKNRADSYNTDDWLGLTVGMTVIQVQYKGEVVPALRIVEKYKKVKK